MGESENGRRAMEGMQERFRSSGIDSKTAENLARESILRAERREAGEKNIPSKQAYQPHLKKG